MTRCTICLKSDKEYRIINGSPFVNIFIRIVGVNKLSELWLCTWCLTILKKTFKLQQMYLEIQELSKRDEQLQSQSRNLFEFDFHTISIDIPPLEENEIKKIKTELDEDLNPKLCMESQLHTEFVCINQDNTTEINIYDISDSIAMKRKHDKLTKKNINIFKRLGFKVSFLTVKEQIEDVNIMRRSKQYSEMYHKCEHCAKGFVTLESFEEHKLRHTLAAGPHICPICNLHFKSREVFTQHALTHKRRFKCVQCDAVFKKWSNCIRHRYKCMDNNVTVSCSMCSKVFSDDISLYTHVRNVHGRDKKYACQECSSTFATKQRLIVHNRSHTGHKPYCCKICSKKFTTNSNLRSHTAEVHITTRQFYCVECNSYYKSNKTLQRHFTESVKHHIPGDLTYKCSECSMRFRSEKRLNTHTRTRHLTTHRCTHCDKIFVSSANLKKHIRCVHSKKN